MKSRFIFFLLLFTNLLTHGYDLPKSLDRICPALRAQKNICSTKKSLLQSSLSLIAISCQEAKNKSNCAEFEKTLPPESKEKIQNCSEARLCDSYRESPLTSCVVGGVTMAIDTVMQILNLPSTAMQFASEAFAEDKNCFDNKDGKKELLLNLFDGAIPEEHKAYRLSPEVKKAMVKSWSCREIRQYLFVKQKNYNAFLGPLVASGKINNSKKSESPLLLAIQSIQKQLTSRYNCYTPSAITEMNCYMFSAAALALMGGKTSTASLAELKPYGFSNLEISRIETSLAQSRALVAGETFAELNPQIKVWKLRSQAVTTEADILEKKLIEQMKNGKIIDSKAISIGDNNARYVELDNGIQGIWKPTNVVYAKSKLTHEKGAAYETAAYVVDKTLGTDLVPVTIPKMLNGEPGSLQLRVTQLTPNTEPFPKSMMFFDDLVANSDRNQSNLLISDGRRVAIDNGLAFRNIDHQAGDFDSLLRETVGSYTKSSPPALKAKIKEELNTFMPKREVYEKLATTTVDEWRKSLSQYLNQQELAAFLKRRNILIEAVENARMRFGDDLFP